MTTASRPVAEAPAFEIRGVIEGFYGPPWRQQQRVEMIEFIAHQGMNTYFYAPKDDRYLRERWRDDHDADLWQRLVDTIAACHRHGIAAIVGVSPGLSMRYGDDADRQRLVDKFARLLDAGVDRPALLFDDIPGELLHEGDRQAYRSLAAAHADVANHVAAAVTGRGSANALIVCPTQYWGAGDGDELVELGTSLRGDIDVLWTGRAICSPEITAAEAVTFHRSALRPPLYWDNYPVNDVAMTAELHIGPYRRRDPLLGRFSVGVLANAMEHVEASKIAVATIADFLRSPADYDPDESWARAIRTVVGDEFADAFTTFADCVRGSCLAEPDPVWLGGELARFEFEVAHGDAAAALDRLATVADELDAAAATLRSSSFATTPLAAEIAPWLDKFALGGRAVRAIVAAHAAHGSGGDDGDERGGDRRDEAIDELVAVAGELRRRAPVVFGSLVDMTIDHLLDDLTLDGRSLDDRLQTAPDDTKLDTSKLDTSKLDNIRGTG